MPQKLTREYILDLIKNGKDAKALEMLTAIDESAEILPDFSSVPKDAALLQGQLRALERDVRKGILTQEQARVERSRIRVAILDLVGELLASIEDSSSAKLRPSSPEFGISPGNTQTDSVVPAVAPINLKRILTYVTYLSIGILLVYLMIRFAGKEESIKPGRTKIASVQPTPEFLKSKAILVGDPAVDNGTAYYIGQSEQNLFVVTAAHVLEYLEKDSISGQFFNGATVVGKLFREDVALDVSVIQCPIPSEFQIPTPFKINQTPIETGQSVQIIGHPYGNSWDLNQSAKIKEPKIKTDVRFFTLTTTGVHPGCSGGPVLSTNGEVLGMVLRVDAVKTTAI